MPSYAGEVVSVTTSVTELSEAVSSSSSDGYRDTYDVILTNEGASTVFVATAEAQADLTTTTYMWRLAPSTELTLTIEDGADEGVSGCVASGTCSVHVARRTY